VLAAGLRRNHNSYHRRLTSVVESHCKLREGKGRWERHTRKSMRTTLVVFAVVCALALAAMGGDIFAPK
jgi:hypothetical protein